MSERACGLQAKRGTRSCSPLPGVAGLHAPQGYPFGCGRSPTWPPARPITPRPSPTRDLPGAQSASSLTVTDKRQILLVFPRSQSLCRRDLVGLQVKTAGSGPPPAKSYAAPAGAASECFSLTSQRAYRQPYARSLLLRSPRAFARTRRSPGLTVDRCGEDVLGFLRSSAVGNRNP